MRNDNYHHENLKSELVNKGLKLLLEVGYDNFSLRKVAKACGVSHTAPYRHFKNKDDLIVAIALEAQQKFNRSLEEAVEKYPADINSQLKEMGFAYVKFFVENPEYLQLLFLTDIGNNFRTRNQEKLNACTQSYNTFYQAIKRYIAEKPNKASGACLDENALILSNWGLVHGMAILIARKEFAYDGDYLELAHKVFWGGPDLGR